MRERELSHHAVWSVPGAVGEFVHFLTTLAFPRPWGTSRDGLLPQPPAATLRHASHTAHTQQHV